jgi:bacterial/archaeal transporter family protein
MNWIAASFFALSGFGLWGLFTKLSVIHIDAKSALIFQTIGVMLIGIVTLGFMNFKPETNFKGIGYAILTGLAYGAGCLFYFIAASKGKIITVVTFTALYPLVTIILAYYFLKETVSLRQCCGIGLGFVSMLLMAV